MNHGKIFFLTVCCFVLFGLNAACRSENSTTEKVSVDNLSSINTRTKAIEAAILRGEVIKEADLSGLPPEKLRILRNVIFAKHGRIYQKPGLGDYFAACDWYRPDPAYTDAAADSLLTINDKSNAQILLRQEQIAKTSPKVVASPNNSDNKSVETVNIELNIPISSPSIGISLSTEAQEVSNLLDDRKFVAAEKLLNSYLLRRSNDAGLYCQYVRYLISANDITADPFIASPLRTDDKYRVSALIPDAARTAAELDPRTKSFLADTILREIFNQISERADRGEGYIVPGTISDNLMAGVFFGNNQINQCWLAIELAPEIGKQWAAKYESLVPKYAGLGKSISAMFTGNLTGDLASAGQGDVDFEKATSAFKTAVDAGKSDAAGISETGGIYVQLFESECRRAAQRRDSNYLGLLDALKRSGNDLKFFRDKNLVPAV